MADVKITALAVLTAADPINDAIPIVDVSDISMAASGTTKRISVNNILGASGTATLASATITGDLTVDTSTLKVDSTNNRVGIGTATPGAPLHLQSATATFKLESSTGTNPAYLYATSTGGDFYFGRDDSTGTTFGTGTGYSAIVYSSNAYPMVFFTNATERARITSSGDVNITTGNVVMGTSGKGIDFSATAGTGTSELLADYEEGTWTPTDGSGAGLAFTVSNCRYTKVGRAVTVQGGITYPATVNASNALWGGFPFNAADIITLSVIYTDASLATFTYLSGNTGNVYLLTPGVNTINSTVSGKTITFSGTYMV